MYFRGRKCGLPGHGQGIGSLLLEEEDVDLLGVEFHLGQRYKRGQHGRRVVEQYV